MPQFDLEVEAFLKRPSYSRSSFQTEELEPAEQITIRALTGAGKTTLLKELKSCLPKSFHFVSGGSIMRQKAASKGLSIEQFAELNCREPELGHDKECDAELHRISLLRPQLVMESRLSHCVVPRGFHVLLKCPLVTRAYRRFLDGVKSNHRLTQGKVLADMASRDRADTLRLEALYPHCMWPDGDYDLVLDSENTKPDQLAKKLLAEYYIWCPEYWVRGKDEPFRQMALC